MKIHLYSNKFLLTASLLALFLVGCGSVQPAPASTPSIEVDTLQQYLRALAEKDEAAYSHLICPSWEPKAYLEFDAYKGVESQLGDITCHVVNRQDNAANVNCQGKIQQSYGTEKQEVDLSPRIYQLTLSGEVWQVCGFTTTGK